MKSEGDDVEEKNDLEGFYLFNEGSQDTINLYYKDTMEAKQKRFYYKAYEQVSRNFPMGPCGSRATFDVLYNMR